MQAPHISPARHLLLGVTGGVAAYKSAELLRLWVRAGHTVDVVLTDAAQAFVGAATFQALSGRPVHTGLWNQTAGHGMDHIALARKVDAVIVAPATADFIGKVTHGLADDLLSTLCLARDCPLLIAPAMNRQMWEHPATQRNVGQLAEDGVVLLGPASGEQACGETGPGRMLEPAEIAELVDGHFAPRCLAGRRVLITAGPTFEAVDAVRGITNRSSGRMGYSVARAARDAGASVTLVSGPVALIDPPGIRTLRVNSAAEMLTAVEAEVAGCDIFISVAAVADYYVLNPSEQKIKKDAHILTLELAPNPDILANIASRPDAPFCVGFAAESENLEDYARRKRLRKHLPLIAANLAQDAIGRDDSQITLLDDDGVHPLPRADKQQSARWLIEHIATLYHRQRA